MDQQPHSEMAETNRTLNAASIHAIGRRRRRMSLQRNIIQNWAGKFLKSWSTGQTECVINGTSIFQSQTDLINHRVRIAKHRIDQLNYVIYIISSLFRHPIRVSQLPTYHSLVHKPSYYDFHSVLNSAILRSDEEHKFPDSIEFGENLFIFPSLYYTFLPLQQLSFTSLLIKFFPSPRAWCC